MHRGCHEREDGGTLNGSLSKTTYSQSRGGDGGGGGSCSGRVRSVVGLYYCSRRMRGFRETLSRLGRFGFVASFGV